jgi:hypothetical protein
MRCRHIGEFLILSSAVIQEPPQNGCCPPRAVSGHQYGSSAVCESGHAEATFVDYYGDEAAYRTI